MKRMRWLAVILTIVMGFMLGSCGENKATNANAAAAPEDLEPVSSLTIDEEEAAVLNQKVPVCLYFSDEQQTKLVKEIRYLDINEAKKGANALASSIVKELLAGPKANGLKAVIPDGTSLRSPIKIEDRVAVVDLTKDFIDKHPGGKTMEELTVYSIVNTLTEMKEVERVKIIINGKETKNFKGNVLLNSDFPRNEAIVNKEVGMARPEDGGLEPAVQEETPDLSETSSDEDPLE